MCAGKCVQLCGQLDRLIRQITDMQRSWRSSLHTNSKGSLGSWLGASLLMNMLAYEGAIFVPMAIPCICLVVHELEVVSIPIRGQPWCVGDGYLIR